MVENPEILKNKNVRTRHPLYFPARNYKEMLFYSQGATRVFLVLGGAGCYGIETKIFNRGIMLVSCTRHLVTSVINNYVSVAIIHNELDGTSLG